MRSTLAALSVAMALFAGAANAGPYAEELGECLAAKTSQADKNDLMRWFFVVIAANPELAFLMSVTAQNRIDVNQRAGTLYQRLLTEDCPSQTKAALTYEGNAGLGSGFEALGKLAVGSLMTNPATVDAMRGFLKYIDFSKVAEIMPDKSE